MARLDRRTVLKWMLSATVAVPVLGSAASPTDPDLQRIHAPGDLWPLTLGAQERASAAALCDLIIPEDERSPSASAVGVVDFIDEWISAPYPRQRADRTLILAGFAWLDAESARRFGRFFAALAPEQRTGICDDICSLEKALPAHAEAATFFARYRDLTAGAFYTTPVGMSDIRYVGNIPLARFDGPPPEVLRAAGLA